MMQYGSGGGGGGGGATNFWKLLGGAPNDIDVNTVAGVSGILASLPTNIKLKILLKSFAGADFAGNFRIDGTEVYFSGVSESGGSAEASHKYDDGAGNSTEDIIVNNQAIMDSTDGDNYSSISRRPDQLDHVVGNMTDGKNTQYTMHKDYHFFFVKHGAVDVFRILLTENGFQMDDGGGPSLMVRPAGRIYTNQVQAVAPFALPALLTDYIQLYDTTGTIPTKRIPLI